MTKQFFTCLRWGFEEWEAAIGGAGTELWPLLPWPWMGQELFSLLGEQLHSWLTERRLYYRERNKKQWFCGKCSRSAPLPKNVLMEVTWILVISLSSLQNLMCTCSCMHNSYDAYLYYSVSGHVWYEYMPHSIVNFLNKLIHGLYLCKSHVH